MKYLLALPYEIWRGINEVNGLYQVSNFRRVMNIKTGRILKPVLQTTGYLTVSLCRNGVSKIYSLHRLVAQAFPDLVEWTDEAKGKPFEELEVDHINRDRADNRLENLCWCTHKDNMNNKLSKEYFKQIRGGENSVWYGKYSKEHPQSKPILQYDKNNNLIKEWECTADVERELGILRTSINNCLKNRSKTAGGYIWKYQLNS